MSLVITTGQRAHCIQFSPVEKIRVLRIGLGRPRKRRTNVSNVRLCLRGGLHQSQEGHTRGGEALPQVRCRRGPAALCGNCVIQITGSGCIARRVPVPFPWCRQLARVGGANGAGSGR